MVDFESSSTITTESSESGMYETNFGGFDIIPPSISILGGDLLYAFQGWSGDRWPWPKTSDGPAFDDSFGDRTRELWYFSVGGVSSMTTGVSIDDVNFQYFDVEASSLLRSLVVAGCFDAGMSGPFLVVPLIGCFDALDV
jgi:hypothetical protein